ncbi:tetratricopeptide repeat protein, partial [Nocardia sp. NPDC058497]|uniref:tetratricopeptide repeat protein n=1 Tax=Nocardia sp. NPDC058497 TaxID=3346529 RepID=UPI00364DC3E3
MNDPGAQPAGDLIPLAQRYTSADPIDWCGAAVYPMYAEALPEGTTVVRVRAVSVMPPAEVSGLGLGLTVQQGHVRLSGKSLQGVDIWYDALAAGVDIPVTADGPEALFTLTPVWVAGSGTQQSWTGNYGMVVDLLPGRAATLWCSTGPGTPDFNELVVELTTVPAPDPAPFVPPPVSTAAPSIQAATPHTPFAPVTMPPTPAITAAMLASPPDSATTPASPPDSATPYTGPPVSTAMSAGPPDSAARPPAALAPAAIAPAAPVQRPVPPDPPAPAAMPLVAPVQPPAPPDPPAPAAVPPVAPVQRPVPPAPPEPAAMQPVPPTPDVPPPNSAPAIMQGRRSAPAVMPPAASAPILLPADPQTPVPPELRTASHAPPAPPPIPPDPSVETTPGIAPPTLRAPQTSGGQGFGRALYDLGTAMNERGEHDSARTLLTQAAEAGHSGAASDLGVLLLRAGDRAGAE